VAERKSKASEPSKVEEETSISEPSAKKAEPSAAPMEAPQPKPEPEPEPPLPLGPNSVAPIAPITSEGTRLLGEDGEEVDIKDCLEYPGPDDPGILVTVNRRIYREYTHPHSVTKMIQLVHPKGAIITKADAQRLRAEQNPPSEGALTG
jgi:hypothetical protein